MRPTTRAKSDRSFGSINASATVQGARYLNDSPDNPTGQSLGSKFWALWLATFFSNLGDGLSLVAIPWVAIQLTDNSVSVAGFATATRLPWLLFALPAGVLIDRMRRLNLMIGANVARLSILIVLGLTLLTGALSVEILLVLTFLLGTSEVILDTTNESVVPSLVPSADLPRANGQIRSAEIVTNDFLGRPLGAFVIKWGLYVPFFAHAIVTAFSVIVLAWLRLQVTEPSVITERQPLLADIRAGLSFVWHQSLLRLLAFMVVTLSGFYASVLGVQVLFIQRILGLGPIGFALILTAASLGAVIGSQFAWRTIKWAGAARALLIAMAVLGCCLFVVGFTSNFVVIGALYTVAGGAVTTINVVRVSLIQQSTPREMLGRVNAIFRLLTWGISPLAMMLGGVEVAVAEGLVGMDSALRLPYLIAGAGTLLTFVILASSLPWNLRRAFRKSRSDEGTGMENV